MKKIIYISFLLIGINVSAQVQKEDKQKSFEEAVPLDRNTEENEDAVYGVAGLQVAPSFEGSFTEEILKSVNTSDNGAPSSFKAKAFVSFIIERDGSLTNIKCTRDPGYGFGKEIKESVERIKKKWNPGLHNGKQVRVIYILPVEIKVP